MVKLIFPALLFKIDKYNLGMEMGKTEQQETVAFTRGNADKEILEKLGQYENIDIYH